MHAVMCVYVCGSGGGQMVEHAHARARTHIHTHMLPVDGGDRGEDAQAAGDLDGAWRVLLHQGLVCTVCVCARAPALVLVCVRAHSCVRCCVRAECLRMRAG